MNTVNLTPVIALTTHRCYDCKRWFAYEAGENSRCPMCATKTSDRYWVELQTQKRTIAALRGALKRKGRKR